MFSLTQRECLLSRMRELLSRCLGPSEKLSIIKLKITSRDFSYQLTGRTQQNIDCMILQIPFFFRNVCITYNSKKSANFKTEKCSCILLADLVATDATCNGMCACATNFTTQQPTHFIFIKPAYVAVSGVGRLKKFLPKVETVFVFFVFFFSS